MALKHGLPVVTMDFVLDCLEDKCLKDISSYVVGGKSTVLDFKAGKIGDCLFTFI